jgi:HEAT repeat protein
MRRTIVAIALGLLCLALAPNVRASSFLDRKLSDWLTDLERGRKPSVRRSAAFALGRLGNLASLAVPDLTRRIKNDRDASVRDMAACSLGDIVLSMSAYFPPRSQWDTAGKTLEDALADSDPRVRRSAAYALGAFGNLAGPAVPALRKALRDSNPSVRQNAAWALGRVGSALDSSGVADLCDLLNDQSVLVRRDAAFALGSLGKSTGQKTIRHAGKPLLDMVRAEKDEVVRKTALGALAALAGPEHRAFARDLYPLLESKDPETAINTAYALGSMGGEPGQRALPVLRKALSDPDPNTQALAAASLARAGKEAAALAVDDLARALTLSREPDVRRNCCVALAHLGSQAKPAIPAIVEALKPLPSAPADPNRARPYEEVRELAAEALAQVGYPDNQAAIPAIRDTIARDKNQIVRQRCIWALFNLRDLDKFDLTKPLTAVLDEKDEDSIMVRYDTSRLLAACLEERAPDRVVDVLLNMINNRKLRVFNKTDASIEDTGNEGSKGSSTVAPDLGGDARYMAAEAMRWLKDKAKNNEKVVAALRAAAKSRDARLRKEAEKSLEKLGLER